MFHRLLAHFGPRGWWPGDSPFEIMTGAVLTQNTAWGNVEKAIFNLKAAGVLSPEKIQRLEPDTLAALIRPSGYHRVKAGRLMNMVRLVMAHGGGDPPRILSFPPDELRSMLLSVNGIGPETADSILLYAADRPFFVIDAYTRRILTRHGLASGKESYEDLQALFMDHMPHDTALFNEFHALIVNAGKHYCKPKPKCGLCPLREVGLTEP